MVEAHLAASNHTPSLLLGDYVCLASGGSSGRRGTFVQTLAELSEFVGSLLRRAVAASAASGGPPGLTIALVAAASPIHSTGFGAATNRGGPVRLVPFPATAPIEHIVAGLNEEQPPTLMGYPSKLTQLATEQRAGRLHIAPRIVISISEVLTGQDRATLTSTFGAPVVDSFASTEGLVGQSEPGGSMLTFATDNCLAELVDGDNRPVSEGRASAKVLVTNLHNFTQPLIRYELTDRFVRHPDDPAGHVRASVDGRADDVFRYGRVEVHPLVVRSAMVAAAAVTEYQVHQTPRGVDIDAVVDGHLDRAALRAALEEGLLRAGLVDPPRDDPGRGGDPRASPHRQGAPLRPPRSAPRPTPRRGVTLRCRSVIVGPRTGHAAGRPRPRGG